jgi:hypothetical protein
MLPASLDEARGRLGLALNRGDECVAIRPQQNHALMFFQQPTRAFVGQIAGCKSGYGHSLMNKFPGRESQPQLQALHLEFPQLGSRFPS